MIARFRQLLTDARWTLVRRGLLILIWIALATLTHIPVPQVVQEIRISDKLIHLLAYFPLGLLLPLCGIRGCQHWGICLLILALYGVVDELLQIPVGRTASVFDWLADLFGASLGLVVSQRFLRDSQPSQS